MQFQNRNRTAARCADRTCWQAAGSLRKGKRS